MKELNDLNEKLKDYEQLYSNNCDWPKLFYYHFEKEFEDLVYKTSDLYESVFYQECHLAGKEETYFYERSDCQLMFKFLEKAFKLLNRNDLSDLVRTNANDFMELQATYWQEKFSIEFYD